MITKCEFTYMKFAKSISTRWPIAQVWTLCSKKRWRLFSVDTIVAGVLRTATASLLSAMPRTVS